MARKLMKNIDGERLRFSATFVRYGSKRAFFGPALTTLLLRDIRRVDTGAVVADHIWFTTNKTFEAAAASLGGFIEGDVFEFDARVKTYLKGYRGRREDVDKPVELDYKLSHPTKVAVRRSGVSNPQTSPPQWANLISDNQLGGLYRDWLSLSLFESACPSAERLTQYAEFARQLLTGDDPQNLADDFARFCRVRLVGMARSLDLSIVSEAFDAGRDFTAAEVYDAVRARNQIEGWTP